jgi:phosphonopyruvate decarboxylase
VTATALGIALGWPSRKVVSIEGDGSLLMGLTSLVTVGRYAPSNLVVLVFDNGVYLTTGSGRAPSPTSVVADIQQAGQAVGIRNAATVENLEDLRETLTLALSEPGPWLVVAKVDTSDRSQAHTFSPLSTDVFEGAQRFRSVAVDQRSHP